MDSPDNLLMLKVRHGDVAKLSVLFERHHRKLYRYFVRLTADRELSDDLVQDVFFRMLKYKHTYGDQSQFTAWMYQIARNAHLDSTQKGRSEIPLQSEEGQYRHEPISLELKPDERITKRQEIAILRQALAALPLEKREVLVLSRYQNLKYEEIAEILHCEVGAVKVRVYRAIKDLGRIFMQ